MCFILKKKKNAGARARYVKSEFSLKWYFIVVVNGLSWKGERELKICDAIRFDLHTMDYADCNWLLPLPLLLLLIVISGISCIVFCVLATFDDCDCEICE